MKITIIMVIFLSIIPLLGQETDSTSQKSPVKAAKRALLLPGGGQFYNGQKVKGILLLSSGIGAGLLYFDNANNYKNFNGIDASKKSSYLKLRNKYGWWLGFVYIYGLLDAIVEAHLHPFKDVMSEDLEELKLEVEDKNE